MDGPYLDDSMGPGTWVHRNFKKCFLFHSSLILLLSTITFGLYPISDYIQGPYFNAVDAELHILELFSLIFYSVLYCITVEICDIALFAFWNRSKLPSLIISHLFGISVSSLVTFTRSNSLVTFLWEILLLFTLSEASFLIRKQLNFTEFVYDIILHKQKNIMMKNLNFTDHANFNACSLQSGVFDHTFRSISWLLTLNSWLTVWIREQWALHEYKSMMLIWVKSVLPPSFLPAVVSTLALRFCFLMYHK